MCESSLRTLPAARPLSWSVEVELLRFIVRAHRVGAFDRGEAFRQARRLAEGSLEYALLSPAERETRQGEFSASAVELVRAMEKGKR